MNPNQHILITAAWYPTTKSAKGIFVKEQAEALARAGHKVNVLLVDTVSFGGRIKQVFKGKGEEPLPANGFKLLRCNVVFPFYLRWITDQSSFQKKFILRKVSECVRKHAAMITLIHHHCLSDNVSVALALSAQLNVPLVYTEHSNFTTDAELNKFNNYETFEDRLAFVRLSKARIAVSESWAKIYASIYDAPFSVIPNMTDEMFGVPLRRKPAELPFTFCSIAGFDTNKHQDLMIRAFAAEFGGDQQFALSLAGTGRQLDRCKQLARELKVEAQVKFPGHIQRNEVVEFIDNADALVSASDKETFGIVLVEGMMRGKPAVSTRSGGPDQIVTPATGILCPVGDVPALAAAMRSLYSNYSQFEPEAIRKYAEENYSASAIIPRLTSLYGRLTAAH